MLLEAYLRKLMLVPTLLRGTVLLKFLSSDRVDDISDATPVALVVGWLKARCVFLTDGICCCIDMHRGATGSGRWTTPTWK